MIVRNAVFEKQDRIGAREKDFRKLQKESVVFVLENLRSSDLVEINNQYCEEENYTDDMIFPMDELEDHICGMEPIEIVRMVSGTDFNLNHNYFKFTIYGIESFDWPDGEVSIGDIASYIVRRGEDFGNDDIHDALCMIV